MTDSPPPAPEVDLDALAAALADGAPLVDVRTPEEYEQARVPGARLIPLDQLNSRADEIPRDQRVYVICALGGRSMAAATALNAAGWETVNVAGGTNAWVEAGRPYESGPA
ncbi:MAG TPA: rhodanese-like domain-containing protein [Acidimicrobiales bacterium]|nr:rhodanese-like domain-containing protein [Acidimicrobiales bacterium]